jgi:predicted DNA-binding protein YlxM (UPF0122 family)
MREKRRTRSSKYQQIFHEILFADDTLAMFMNEDSIQERLSGGFSYDERILDLEDKLKERFWELVDNELTERQAQVLHLYSKNYTQNEIAVKLSINQSSVAKSLHGNANYSKNKNDKIKKPAMYGGSDKKLKALIDQDEIIQNILEQMHEIRENKW